MSGLLRPFHKSFGADPGDRILSRRVNRKCDKYIRIIKRAGKFRLKRP